jgi:hypothetical protein
MKKKKYSTLKAFSLKMLEQSKVLFFEKILDNLPFNQVCIIFPNKNSQVLK